MDAELDPNLQITGEYEVRLAASQAINIRVQIGGTLSRPRIALDSDAQPPLSQSDLLSYLAFGRTSSSLLQFEGSSLSGGGGGSGIAGTGAQLATQQLAAVALGVFVNEFESQAARSLGAAYVNVTPADLYTELAQSGEISGFFKGTRNRSREVHRSEHVRRGAGATERVRERPERSRRAGNSRAASSR